jgi:DEAD/DEAH box helicase domain-containing protein
MHEGAIYLHRGDAFIVDDIDSTKKEVKVSPVHYSYYTYPSTEKETIIKSTLNEYKDNLIDVKYCELQVTEKFKGYTKISTKTGQKLQEIALEKEPVTFITKGICLTLPEDIIKEIQTIKLNHMGSIHAAEHALIALIPTFILCDRADIGGISYPFHPQINASAIFIYDGYPGGIGLTKRIFEKTKLLIEKTYIQVEGCDCEDGCPACIYSPKCGSGNYPIDKKGSIHLLKSLLIPVNKSAAKQASIPIKNTVKRHSIVFDIETKYGADDVGGWKNADKMGMSVAVAYSLEDNEYLYFEESNMGSFLSLLENARLLVGFNIINFDIKVLSGYGKLNISHIPKLDILLNVKMITGRLFSLDKLASATLKAQKSGNGLQALKWYEEGNMEKLFEYCKHDVELTRDILFFGLKEKFIYAPAGENIIKVFVDWSHFLSE